MRTPTSGTEPAHGGGQAGFTLVELLAVLAILSLAVAAFAFRTGTSLDTAKFRALMIGTASAMRQARTEAIVRQREQVFVVNTALRRMTNPVDGSVLAIPDGVDLTVTAAESLTFKDGTAGIKFYADGTSSGGVLSFTWNGRSYAIEVNWLTGNVSLNGI